MHNVGLIIIPLTILNYINFTGDSNRRHLPYVSKIYFACLIYRGIQKSVYDFKDFLWMI